VLVRSYTARPLANKTRDFSEVKSPAACALSIHRQFVHTHRRLDQTKCRGCVVLIAHADAAPL
jgi:hypothetical protein